MYGHAKLTTLILLIGFGLACNSGSRPERDQDRILNAVREHLEFEGESVPNSDRPISWQLEVGRPPDKCFADISIPTDVIAEFERLNINPQSEPFKQWINRQTDRIAGRIIGEEPDPPVALFHSRISFSETAPFALIYIEDHTPLSGFGAFFLLQKRSEGWWVDNACYMWHS